MLRNPFTKWLWDNRRSLVGWTLAIAAVGGMYAAFWPSFDNPQMQEAIANYPSALLDALNYNDISTPAGYLSATVYGLIVAVLTIVFAVTSGTRMVAGDEEAGTLDLILAHPLSRTRLALQRFAAFLVTVVIVAAGLLLVLLAISGPADLTSISAGGFAAMNLHLVLFAAFFAAISYAAGAATGRKALALGCGAGVAVVGFAANGLLPQVDGLAWVEAWSPFHWLTGGRPLEHGVQLGHVTVMAVLVLALVAFGTWAFDRRDVGV